MIVEAGDAGSLGSDLSAVGVPVATSEGGPVVAAPVGGAPGLASFPGQLDQAWCARHRFSGKVGQTLYYRTGAPGSADDADIVLVGVGDAALDGDSGLESLRRAAAAFVRVAGSGAAAFLVPATPLAAELSAAAVAEGALLASYRYETYRTGEHPESLQALTVVVAHPEDAPAAASGVARGARLAASVALARDLVNQPPSSLTPEKFASVFVDRFAGRDDVSVEVWDQSRIVAERLGGLLGVARGSTQEPRLLWAEYRPADPIEIDGRVPHLALVGKGITFDSGGSHSRRRPAWRP